jgi:hypothetical protein
MTSLCDIFKQQNESKRFFRLEMFLCGFFVNFLAQHCLIINITDVFMSATYFQDKLFQFKYNLCFHVLADEKLNFGVRKICWFSEISAKKK